MYIDLTLGQLNNYKDELTPLIQSCGYNKGSLIQTTLQCFLKDNCSQRDSVTKPFPPLYEASLEPQQRASLMESIRAAQILPFELHEDMYCLSSGNVVQLGLEV